MRGRPKNLPNKHPHEGRISAERRALIDGLFGAGHSVAYVVQHCAKAWKCSEFEAAAMVEFVRQRIVIETEGDREALRGAMRLRYNDIYERAMDAGDFKTALKALEFISDFEGLKFDAAKPLPPVRLTMHSGIPRKLQSTTEAAAKLKELQARNVKPEPEEVG